MMKNDHIADGILKLSGCVPEKIFRNEKKIFPTIKMIILSA